MSDRLRLLVFNLKDAILKLQKLLQNIDNDIKKYRISKPLKPMYGHIANLLVGLCKKLRSILDIEMLNNGSFVVKKKRTFVDDEFVKINDYLQNFGYKWIESDNYWKKQKN